MNKIKRNLKSLFLVFCIVFTFCLTNIHSQAVVAITFDPLASGGGTGFSQISGNWFDPQSRERVWPADIDGDGKTDIVGIANNGNIYYCKSSGNGSFENEACISVTIFDSLGGWFSTTLNQRVWPADINGDGKIDFVGVTNDGHFYYSMNKGNCTFDPFALGGGTGFSQISGNWFDPQSRERVWPADIDGDGKTDIVGIANNGNIYYCKSSGNGSFENEACISVTIFDSLGGWFSTTLNQRVWPADINGNSTIDFIGIGNSGSFFFSKNNYIPSSDTNPPVVTNTSWYSQIQGTINGTIYWNTTNLNNLYYGSTPFMTGLSGDLMDQGCTICCMAMVLRNMGKTMYGDDIRIGTTYNMLADPYSVMLANIGSDGTDITYSNGNYYLDATYSPIWVHWGSIVSPFGASYSFADGDSDIMNTSNDYKVNLLKNAVASNPEGVVVQFIRPNGWPHSIVFKKYNSVGSDENSNFIVYDPGTIDTVKGINVKFSKCQSFNQTDSQKWLDLSRITSIVYLN